MTKPDPYAEFRSLAMTLESEGVDVDTIIDACFTVATHGAIRTAGREATADTLTDMARMIADGGTTRPTTAH
jgi:hypothetical protein